MPFTFNPNKGLFCYNDFMRVIADLHIHSPYSRAVSREMTIPNLDIWARKKGVSVLGTGDFTHHAWFKHLEENLEEAESGLYIKRGQVLSNKVPDPLKARFIYTTEISSIYGDGGKVRRVHNLILASSREAAEKITKELAKAGAKLASDGRPIVGISR